MSANTRFIDVVRRGICGTTALLLALLAVAVPSQEPLSPDAADDGDSLTGTGDEPPAEGVDAGTTEPYSPPKPTQNNPENVGREEAESPRQVYHVSIQERPWYEQWSFWTAALNLAALFVLVWMTTKTAKSADRSARAAAESTQAAFEANQHAELAHYEQHRPLLEIDHSSHSALTWLNGAPSLSMVLAVSNHGDMPAMQASTHMSLFLGQQTARVDIEPAFEEFIRRSLALEERLRQHKPTEVFYPHKTVAASTYTGVTVTPEQVEDNKTAFPTFEDEEPIFCVKPFIFAIIRYTGLGERHEHYSAHAFEVSRIPTSEMQSNVITVGTDVTRELLAITRSPWIAGRFS